MPPSGRRVGHSEDRRVEPGDTGYAKSGDLHIAYQELGRGPALVLIADWFGHIDTMWDWPPYAHSLRRLASFSRLVVFDKRGVGLSDPIPVEGLPDMVEWSTDIGAVLDDLGIWDASLMGVGAGGPLCIAFAATAPRRVRRLVLVNSYARLARADDYRPGYPRRIRDRVLSQMYTDEQPAGVLRGADDPAFTQWWRRYQRQSVSPAVAAAMRSMMFDVDVRQLLGGIEAPTLVLHRRDDQWVRVDHGHFLVEHIPGATLIELEGSEDLFFHGDVDGLLDHVEGFISDGTVDPSRHRMLTTLVFTDIVDSTALAARVGDRKWRVLLDDHDAVTRCHVNRHDGRLVKLTGDGAMTLFESPGDAIRCASAIRSELQSIGIAVRVGVHTGEVELRSDDIGGMAVHIAARVMDLGDAHQVLVSRTVKDIVTGSPFEFAPRGSHALKGVPGEWEVFEVCDPA